MNSPSQVLQQSPYDATPGCAAPPLVQLRGLNRQEWVPSRFNARTTHPDGRLILWNTYTGAISVFKPAQRGAIEALLARKGFVGEATGAAKYLADRGFLVHREIDELRRVRLSHGWDQYRTDRLELILLASEDCNFRCTYCYEDFVRGTMEPEIRQGIKALLQHRAASLKQMTIGWFGGEPLYGWDAIRDLAPFVQGFCREHDIGLASNMTTNGYLLTPEIAAQLLAWDIRHFQISLDGPPEVHDKRRVGRDGSETFAQILDNLKAMHQLTDEFHVTVRMNFDRDTVPTLEPLLDVLKRELQLDPRFRMYFFAVERWGSVNDDNAAICGLQEGDRAYAHLMKAGLNRGMNVGTGVKEYNNFGGGACYAARPYNFIVGATGKLMKCTVALDKEDYNVVGRLTPEGEIILDSDKLALWTDPAFEDDKVCRKCHVLPLCKGVFCPLERIEKGHRECMPVKHRLRTELITTIDAAQAGTR